MDNLSLFSYITFYMLPVFLCILLYGFTCEMLWCGSTRLSELNTVLKCNHTVAL